MQLEEHSTWLNCHCKFISAKNIIILFISSDDLVCLIHDHCPKTNILRRTSIHARSYIARQTLRMFLECGILWPRSVVFDKSGISFNSVLESL